MNGITAFVFRTKGQIAHVFRNNAPVILTAVGVSGTVTTAYLAGKASYRAAFVIESLPDTSDCSVKDKAKIVVPAVWKLYIPAGISGALTVTSIVAASKVSSKRTATALSVLSITEKAYEEYRDKVTETIGEKKEKSIRDTIAQDRVSSNPPTDSQVLIAGPGNVLCLELLTGRYFHSDMETIRKAENEVNRILLREGYASLEDLYYMLKLPYTSQSSIMGWHAEKMLDISFSAALHEGTVCLAIEYNYLDPI